MEEKLDKKALKKLAEEQQQIQLRKDHLKREEDFGEINLGKIKEKWYDTLLNTRIPEMQDNLRHILHYMEKLIEADSYRKLLFEDEREERAELITLQSQTHICALDTLYDIYQKRVDDLHAAYKSTVNVKEVNATAEFEELEDREKSTQDNLQTMLYQMKENRDQKEDVMNCDMFLKLDDDRSKNTEKQENLRATLEKKMEKRWGEITSTLVDYESKTEARRKHYTQLKIKDDADSKIIYQQMKKTQKLFEQLERMKDSYENSYAPSETMSLIRDLREERTKFFEAFKYLKSVLAQELKLDQAQIKNLTVVSNAITQNLKTIYDKGVQILTLFRICRKLETEQEKITPVGMSFTGGKQNINISEQRKNIDSGGFVDDSYDWAKDYEILKNFWVKAEKVRLSQFALTKCIQMLEKENSILRKALVSYLREVSVKQGRKAKMMSNGQWIN